MLQTWLVADPPWLACRAPAALQSILALYCCFQRSNAGHQALVALVMDGRLPKLSSGSILIIKTPYLIEMKPLAKAAVVLVKKPPP